MRIPKWVRNSGQCNNAVLCSAIKASSWNPLVHSSSQHFTVFESDFVDSTMKVPTVLETIGRAYAQGRDPFSQASNLEKGLPDGQSTSDTAT